MLVKVEPIQIPLIWETIKFVCTETNTIDNKYLDVYLINLLQDLLSSKSVVYVILKNDRISFMTVCSFKLTDISGDLYLSIDNVYAFEKYSNEQWKIIVQDYQLIAKQNDCLYLAGYTVNPRIEELFNFFGFKLFTKTFYKEL